MTSLEFFKASFSNEMKATLDTIRAIPADQLEYTPHPINRTAYEIAEHIAAHVFDFGIILQIFIQLLQMSDQLLIVLLVKS